MPARPWTRDAGAVDPLIWTPIVTAVVAFAGVAMGQLITGSNVHRQSRIERQDEYRREVRAQVALFIRALKNFKAAVWENLAIVARDVVDRESTKGTGGRLDVSRRVEEIRLMAEELVILAFNDGIDREATRAVQLVDDTGMIIIWLELESRGDVTRERLRSDSDSVMSHSVELTECMENLRAITKRDFRPTILEDQTNYRPGIRSYFRLGRRSP